MTAVLISRQIARIAKRVVLLEKFLAHCPEAATIAHADKERELEEYRAVLATLIGHRAANEAAGFRCDAELEVE